MRPQEPRGRTAARGSPSPPPTLEGPVTPSHSRGEPAPTGPRAGGRGVTALALAAACGFLLGVLVVASLGGARASTSTQRVTVRAPALTTGGTVIVKTVVPVMVGEPLDVAKQRAARGRFSVAVDAGGGFFGVIRPANWQVVAQRPSAGKLIEQGSTIHVDIVKR